MTRSPAAARRRLLAGAAGLAFLPLLAHAQERRGAATLMNELMSGRHPVGGDFTLRDGSGRTVRLADFRGKVVLLYFGYAGCADVCPTDLAAIANALALLGPAAQGVQALFVTLDPERDTPEVVRHYASALDPRILGLRGTEAETRRVAQAWKVAYEKVPLPPPSRAGYVVDHTAFLYVVDREGRYRAFLPPGTSGARIAAFVRDQLQP